MGACVSTYQEGAPQHFLFYHRRAAPATVAVLVTCGTRCAVAGSAARRAFAVADTVGDGARVETCALGAPI